MPGVPMSIYPDLRTGLSERRIGRVRPYAACSGICLCAKVIERFSFPTGHALYLTGFVLLLPSHFSSAVLTLIPFTLLLGVSRIVPGLHYPSNVADGAGLRVAVGLTAGWLI